MRTTTTSCLAALTLSAALVLAGCGTDDAQTTADDTAGPVPSDTSSATTSTDPSTPSSTTPSDPPTSSSSTSTPPTDSPADTVPVYFVGDTPNGPRLFRELRDVSANETDQEKLAAAAALLVTGQTLDPDYRTLLPSGMRITNVSLSDGRILVEVGADSQISADKSVSPSDAALAVQQLVYTLQAVSGTRDRVQVVQSDGSSEVPVPLLGVDTTRGVGARPQLKVLGLVNVTSPAQGQSVAGTLTATGYASSFEANVPWQISSGDEDGKVVLRGAATASGYLDRLYPWSTDIDVSALPAGDYTFTAATDDPSDKEGVRPTVDTKSFTVG